MQPLAHYFSRHGDMILSCPLIEANSCLWGVIFSHWVHLKLGHRFHALSKVCTDRDDIVPLMVITIYPLVDD